MRGPWPAASPRGAGQLDPQAVGDRLEERAIVASISPETVRQTLKNPTQAPVESVLAHPP